MDKVEYSGHYISQQGVETDPNKVSTVDCWPIPKYVKEIRSFMRLASYYRKFVKHYSIISKPLIDLLKKGAFEWTDQTQQAFVSLKHSLVSAHVLVVPDFSK